MKYLLLIFFTTSSLFADSPSRECKGIVLLGQYDPLLHTKELDQLSGVEILNPDLCKYMSWLTIELSKKFISKPLNQETVSQIKQTIEEYCEMKDHPLAEVLIPEQEITSGIVQVRIIEGRVGKIEIEGGKYTSGTLVKKYLSSERGSTVDLTQFQKRVSFMNRNPFRRVDLIYSPGTEKNTTDLSVLVDDRRPFRFYTGSDSSGVVTTGRGQFYAGVNLTKLLGLDNFFAYQYTASYNVREFQAQTLQLISYLPWQHVFNVYGGYSTVEATLSFPAKTSHGRSTQTSGRYTIPLNPQKKLNHEFTFGFDFKRTNNTVEYSETFPNFSQPVNLSQFAFVYGGSYESNPIRIDFEGEIFYSPGPMLPDQSNFAYASLRPGAVNHWVYGYASLKYYQKLALSFGFYASARGQLSSQNLLPSEQLGLGGYDTVRGYDERQLNYDNGVILNLELRTPTLPVFRRKKKREDALQFLGFVDYGYGNNRTPIPGEPKGDHLLGIGPGARYTIDPWFSASLDFGVKLHRNTIFTGGSGMWYFSVSASL